MSEVPEKRVLAQDLPQYQQSQRARTIAQQKEAEAQYQREVAEIEKQNLSEQQRYEAELEAYKKATQKQREADALKVEYDTEIRKLEEEKADAIARAHSSVWGPGGSRNRSDLNTKLNKIEKQYDNKINKVREQKRVTSGVAEYYLQNPESKLDTSVLRRFQETGSSFNLGILQSQKDVAREARTEYSRQAGVTTARSEAGKIQSAMAGIGTTQGSYGLGEGSERAAAVRPTPDTTAGKKAVESRRPLINVKTVENIYGGQQIETNPRAFVASLTRQDVSSSTGKPTEPQTIFSFQNITDVREESGRALLEFQSQLKTRTAPSATVYKGILEERGLPLTPLSKRIIDTYSSKGLYREYKEPTAAKGKKGIVSKDGEKIFDIGTGMGDVRIGKEFGFVYDYNLQRPTEEKPVLFEGTLQYALSPKVQGPPKPRYEEVVAVPGTLEYAVQNQPGKPTSFNKLLESSYKSVDEFQSSLQKNYPIVSAVGPSQALEAIKIGVATTGFIVSGTEQYVDPFVQDKLGLKRTARPAPLVLGETSDEVLLPVDIGRSFESKTISPKEKYFEGIYEYGKKYGAGSLVVGGYTYYAGRGALQAPRIGLKVGERLVARFVRPTTKLAEREGLAISSGGKRVSIPSKLWDVATVTEKTVSKKQKTPDLYGKITTQKPEPNPFGKERRIPYAVGQAQKKMTGIVEGIKSRTVIAAKKTKRMIGAMETSPNTTIIKSRNVTIPNITRPAPAYSKGIESAKIAFEMKKSAFAKKLSEMENVYRGNLEPSPRYSRTAASIGIGLRMKRKQFVTGVKQKIPEIKTLKGITKLKKETILIGKKTAKAKQDLYKSITNIKPRLKMPYSTKKTSLEIAKFKQKEKLSESLERMKKITEIQETPKAVVPKYGKNFLSRLKSTIGEQEPWDFKSIVKPFQKPRLRKEFASGIRGSPIGKIKGTTSRKEFAEILVRKEKKEFAPKYSLTDLPATSPDYSFKKMMKDIGQIRRKGIDVLTRRERTVQALRGSVKTPDTKLEILKSELSGIGVRKKPDSFFPRYKIDDLPATSPDYSFKKMMKDIGQARRKGLDYIKYRETETKALRGSLKTPDTKFELVQKDVSKIISKSKRIARLRNVEDLKAPAQTIKPIFPVPRKPTELENILEGFKKEKPKNIVYKRVTIDKYIPKIPKSWESWKGVGIVTAAGTLLMLGLGEQKEAEALPFAQVGRIATREIESGRQILIYPEIKSGKGIPSLVPPTPKTIQREEEKEDEKTKLKLITYPKLSTVQTPRLSIEISQPQKVQESFRMATVQPLKITTTPRMQTRQKPRQIPKTIQVPDVKLAQRQKQMVTPKQASPLAPKAPTKLSAPVMPKLRQPIKQIQFYKYPEQPRPPKRAMAALLPDEGKIPKSVLKKEKEKADFLGASSEMQIGGLFKRADITYGQRKISKLLKGDVRVVQGKPRSTRRSKEQKDMLGFSKKKSKNKTRFW